MFTRGKGDGGSAISGLEVPTCEGAGSAVSIRGREAGRIAPT